MTQSKKRLRGNLRKGRAIRAAQASALADLKNGRVTIRRVLEHPTDAYLSIPIHRILESTPKLGDKGCRKVLEKCGVWPLDTLGATHPHVRQSILENLPRRVFEKYPTAKM